VKQEKTNSEIWTPVKQAAACGRASAALARKSDCKAALWLSVVTLSTVSRHISPVCGENLALFEFQ